MATNAKWKRGLLKAWLALSLVWAAGLLFYAVRLVWALEAGLDTIALVLLLTLFSVLPLGALPPFVILALGMSIVWSIDRARGP